ncbi:hypothetical protein L211DRAFT_871667 [Terfezia boudieri ATCC MYA-4762]|uniref:Uncharacterized protein n=1 Tax=Terfezia boudieri ATCC MYA-4762 TaxID=1051890 RepID=A0A3N4L727_9PEZI|nr:hypothetical protein L211DRAFT_871667 [Terfezia boudieri ATCC MYA-4762]
MSIFKGFPFLSMTTQERAPVFRYNAEEEVFHHTIKFAEHMSDPSETTTIPDAFYFAAMEQGGGLPESNLEAFVRTMTNGPVEQQLVNMAVVLYAVSRKVDKLEVKVDKSIGIIKK